MIKHGRNGWTLTEFYWDAADGSAEFSYTHERRTSDGGKIIVDVTRPQLRYWTKGSVREPE